MQRINALSLLCGTTGNENVIFKTMNQQDRWPLWTAEMDSVRWTQEHSSQELQFIYLFSFCFHRFSSGFVFNYVKLASFITCMLVCTVTFAKYFNQTKFLFALLLSLLNMQTNLELVLEASHYTSIRPPLHRTTSTVLLRLHGHQNATCDLFNGDRFYLCLNLFVSNIELNSERCFHIWQQS